MRLPISCSSSGTVHTIIKTAAHVFFSGENIILRRNLERKEAAALFQDMRKIGVVVELVNKRYFVLIQMERLLKQKPLLDMNKVILKV